MDLSITQGGSAWRVTRRRHTWEALVNGSMQLGVGYNKELVQCGLLGLDI